MEIYSSVNPIRVEEIGFEKLLDTFFISLSHLKQNFVTGLIRKDPLTLVEVTSIVNGAPLALATRSSHVVDRKQLVIQVEIPRIDGAILSIAGGFFITYDLLRDLCRGKASPDGRLLRVLAAFILWVGKKSKPFSNLDGENQCEESTPSPLHDIQKLIFNGNIRQGLQKYHEVSKDLGDEQFSLEASCLLGQLGSIQHQYSNGLIGKDHYQLEHTRIIRKVLEDVHHLAASTKGTYPSC